MKSKYLLHLGLIIIVTVLFPCLTLAQSIFDYNGITYKVLKDADEASTFGMVAVTTKNVGFYEGIVSIPNAVRQSDETFADIYKVVAIDDYAFKGSPNLVEVMLPMSIEAIGTGAFEECTELKTVEIPQGNLSHLGESAFAFSGLESITIPEGVSELPRFTFRECRKLERVSLPESLVKIGVSAFIYCRSLKVIDLPIRLREIDICAFSYCGLKRIKLPDKVVALSMNVFSGCFDLEEVHLSPYTTTIASSAFSLCGHLSIIGPESISSIDDSAFLFCWDIPEQYQTPGYKSLLENTGIERMQEQINSTKPSYWK